jgi:hypothetical protein
MNKGIKRGLLAAAFLAGGIGVAQATPAPVINFDQSGAQSATGSLFYNGKGGALTGTNINFELITGNGTPKNDGRSNRLTCSPSCTLAFTTGNNTKEGPTNWDFAAGGSFTLTGTAYDMSQQQVVSGTLLDGTFTQMSNVNGNKTLLTFAGFGTDTKNPLLLDYFGLPNIAFTFGSTDISAKNVHVSSNGGFSGTVTNADIDNTLPVPEPSGLLMLGAGLIGLALVVRRKPGKF